MSVTWSGGRWGAHGRRTCAVSIAYMHRLCLCVQVVVSAGGCPVLTITRNVHISSNDARTSVRMCICGRGTNMCVSLGCAPYHAHMRVSQSVHGDGRGWYV